jgi:hypothetical protein
VDLEWEKLEYGIETQHDEIMKICGDRMNGVYPRSCLRAELIRAHCGCEFMRLDSDPKEW